LLSFLFGNAFTLWLGLNVWAIFSETGVPVVLSSVFDFLRIVYGFFSVVLCRFVLLADSDVLNCLYRDTPFHFRASECTLEEMQQNGLTTLAVRCFKSSKPNFSLNIEPISLLWFSIPDFKIV